MLEPLFDFSETWSVTSVNVDADGAVVRIS